MNLKALPTVLALTFALAAPLAAETNPASAPTFSPQQMEAFNKASTPGEEHKLLQQYVGNWSHIARWWMDPNSPPEVSEGTTEIISIMDGRFIQQNHSGVSMGKPFKGVGITGYDNIAKKYNSIWLDNMSTGMVIGKGSFDKVKNAIIDSGEFSCPMSSTGTRNYRAHWSLPTDNSFKYEMYSTDDKGKEFRMMEIVYKKK